MTTEDLNRKRLDALIRHCDNVRENTILLGERLIEKGESDFGRRLIANGFIHDHSKFSGIEWQYLHGDIKESDPANFLLAAQHHTTHNPHHVEHWGHINEMPRIYVAELTCDIVARSQEFGQDVREWLNSKGIVGYKITKNSKKYRDICGFLQLLLDKPFTK
jgi:hypothetical protein